jgi:hypothetical protein
MFCQQLLAGFYYEIREATGNRSRQETGGFEKYYREVLVGLEKGIGIGAANRAFSRRFLFVGMAAY